MTTTRWWAYLQKLMGNQSQLEAAKFIGISKSNITRWKDGARAAPDFVVKIARAYDANVLEALVEAEFITEEEASLNEVKVGGVLLEESSNPQLIQELVKRLESNQSNKLRAVPDAVSDATDIDDGTVRPFDYGEVAADSSEDEQQAREDRGEDLID